jgi:hypothetical protein
MEAALPHAADAPVPLPDRKDDAVQLGIAIPDEAKLVIEVPMHRGFDGGGACPYSLST